MKLAMCTVAAVLGSLSVVEPVRAADLSQYTGPGGYVVVTVSDGTGRGQLADLHFRELNGAGSGRYQFGPWRAADGEFSEPLPPASAAMQEMGYSYGGDKLRGRVQVHKLPAGMYLMDQFDHRDGVSGRSVLGAVASFIVKPGEITYLGEFRIMEFIYKSKAGTQRFDRMQIHQNAARDTALVREKILELAGIPAVRGSP